jgi:hypothetical protein
MLTCDWAKKGPTDGINRAVLSTVSADRAKMWNRAMQINSPTALAWSRAQPVNGQGCAVRVDKGRRELNADVGGAAWDKIEMAPGHRTGPLPKAEILFETNSQKSKLQKDNRSAQASHVGCCTTFARPG